VTWEELIKDFETKASVARSNGAKLSYKHQATKSLYNVEANTYEECARRVREVLRSLEGERDDEDQVAPST
jgi:hypothetical protein